MSISFNRTKIVATLGPASSSKETLWALIQAGVDLFRLNASHGSHEDHAAALAALRSLNEEHKTHIPALLDLQGPKIRIGTLEEDYPIAPGDELWLATDILAREGNRLPIQYPTFAADVQVGELVLVEDGKVSLEVVETDGKHRAKLRVVNGERIGSRKGVNLPGTKISLPSLTEKDQRDLVFGIQQKVEWVALSFVRTAEDVLLLRQLLRESGSDARIVSKIEKPEAVENIEAIIEVSDAVMVARGDLGVEIPTEDVPFQQKRIIQLCNHAAKPVIVATQMLDSMIDHPRPTRAEATDCANAVLDGADALMLSGETSVGKYPVLTIDTMQSIIRRAEQQPELYHRYKPADPDSRTYRSDAICHAAVVLSEQVDAQAIVAMTTSGYTAFEISKHRPKANIFIFTDQPAVIKALNVVWGVRTLYYDGFESTDSTIADVIQLLKEGGFVDVGDVVVNAASMPLHARQRTNMVKFTVVE